MAVNIAVVNGGASDTEAAITGATGVTAIIAIADATVQEDVVHGVMDGIHTDGVVV